MKPIVTLLLSRFWAVCWAFFTLTLLLSGCSVPFQADKTDSPTLTLATWGSQQEMTLLKAQLQRFEATHPGLKVTLLHIPERYDQKLHLLAAAHQLPDVLFINSWSLPLYAATGHLQPIALKKAQPSGFYPQALAALSYQHKLYAYPRDVSALVVYVNTDLLKRYGLPLPSRHWQWTEALELAKTLQNRANADNQTAQKVFGWSFASRPPLFWLPFVWSWGGNWLSADGKSLTLKETTALAGLQFYQQLRFADEPVAAKLEESGATTMTDLFIQQRLGFLISGRWSVPFLRQSAGFNWDVWPLPAGPAGSRTGVDASGYAVSAHSHYPSQSLELARFLTNTQQQSAASKSGLITPALKAVAQSKFFLQPGKNPKHSQVFLEVLPTGIPTQAPLRFNELSEALEQRLEPVFNKNKLAAQAFEDNSSLNALLEKAAQ